MDSFHLKKYRREAALWAAEGKRAMSIDPVHLLQLLDAHQPPPPPSDQQRLLDQTRRELLATRDQLRVESERANRSHQEGYAAHARDNSEEVRRLRTEVATLRSRKQVAPRPSA